MEGDPISSLRTPALVVDLDKVKKNADKMTERFKKLGVQLRPHMKTHKTMYETSDCVKLYAVCSGDFNNVCFPVSVQT